MEPNRPARPFALGLAAAVPERTVELLDAVWRLMSQAPLVLFAFDQDGIFTIAEGKGLRPLRLQPAELVGRSVFDVYADTKSIVDAARTVLAGVPVSTNIDVDGHLYTVEYVPQYGIHGQVTGAVGLAVEITARRSAADLLASLDLIVWQLDAASLQFSFVSERAIPLLGYPLAEWLRPHFWEEHLHPEEAKPSLAILRAVAADGIERSCVHRLLAADGRARWFRTSVRRSSNGNGETQLTGMMLDITERVGAQAVLTQREERVRLIFEQLPAVVYTVDRDLRFTTNAGAGIAQLGLHPDQTVTGISLYEYFHTDDPEAPLIRAHRRAVAGESIDCEAHWVGRTYALHVDPFRDESGAIIGAIGVALDVTERRRAEQERDRLLIRWKTVVDSIPEGVAVLRADGSLELLNSVYKQLEERVGGGASIEERQRLVEHVDAAGQVLSMDRWPGVRALHGETVYGEVTGVRVRATGETSYYRVTAAPLREGAVISGAIAVFSDVSEEVRFEQLKREFLAAIAHELKTPLAAAKANAQLLLRVATLPQAHVGMLATISRSMDRMNTLVEELIDVSGIILGKLTFARETVDFVALVTRMVEHARHGAGNRVFRIEASGPAPVRVDVARLEQVLRQLLDNAVRYSPAGGAVDVFIEPQATDVVLSVRDNGVGIASDQLPRLFQPFFRAHANTPYDRGGLGVGLFLAREIVRRHGGDITCLSAPGKGSTFCVRLPLEVTS